MGVRVEQIASEPMGSQEVLRAIALLTRWAARKAQKRREEAAGEANKVVTIDVSKDCGSKEHHK